MSNKITSSKKTPTPAPLEKGTKKNAFFVLDKKGYLILAAGFGLLVIGFLFMLGGESKDTNVFDGAKMFSFSRITLSALLVIAGFVVEIYAIMRKPKESAK